MRVALFICAATIAIALAMPAIAAPDVPIASKDGITYTLEDMNLYYLRSLGKDGLEGFFLMMAVYQEGIKQGLKPTAAELTDFINKYMGPDTYNEFKKLFSEKSIRQSMEITMVSDRYGEWLRDKIRKDRKISVTEDEAKKFFFDNITEFHLPEGARISLISVDSKAAADTVYQRLQAGENFNTIASEVNLDPALRAASGVRSGVLRKGDGQLPEVMEKAALALQQGQFSSVIKGDYNYHLIYCNERVPEVSPTFEDVKEDLMASMIEDKIDVYYTKELNDLLSRELPRYNILADLFKPKDAADTQAETPAAPAPQTKPAKPAGGAGGSGAPKVE